MRGATPTRDRTLSIDSSGTGAPADGAAPAGR